jgi:hypothetical protein
VSDLRASWATLRETLTLRRRLEACKFPIEKLGSLASPRSGESHQAFTVRIQERRAETRRENAELKERHGIRTDADLERNLTELREEERQLWAVCRPDLYPLQPV